MKPTVSATRTYSPGCEIHAPDRWIERRKRLIRDEHVAACKRVEQRRLAGIGVADQCNQRLVARGGTPRFSLTAHVFELAAQHADAALDAPAIDFEFGFTGSARTDAAAQSRKIGADADQIRLPIAQLRKLNLQLAFAAARVAREHVENQHRAIDDGHGNHFLEVLALARTQVVEHEDELGLVFFDQLGDFAGLATPDKRRRIEMFALLYDARDDLRAGSLR